MSEKNGKIFLRVEAVDNGWIVNEITFLDDQDDDDDEEWSRDREGPHGRGGCNHGPERTHVFVDHTKLMAFLFDRTKPAKLVKS